MSLLQGPGTALNLILGIVMIGTAVVAAVERKGALNAPPKSNGPLQWLAGILLLWVVCYPAYMYSRKKYGFSNRLIPALAVTVIFLGSAAAISFAIDEKVAEVKSAFGKLAPDSPNTTGDSPNVAPGQTTAPSAAPPISISATKLFEEYHANEVLADQNYKGKMLAVRGVVLSIEKDFADDPYVKLRVDESDFNSIDGHFSKDENSKLATLKIGDEVTLTCLGAGMLVQSPQLDCRN